MTTNINSFELQNIKEVVKILLDNKQYSDALLVLTQIPNACYKIKNKIASIYEILKNYKAAETYYKQSIDIEPHPTTFNKLGMLYHYHLKCTNNARETYLKCIQMDENHIFCKHNLAKLCLECGEYQNADNYFTQCLKMDQSKACIHYHYSLLCYRLNRKYESLYHIEKAVVLQSTIAKYHYQCALTCNKLNDFEKTNKSFKTAIKLSNNDVQFVSEYEAFLNDNKEGRNLEDFALKHEGKQTENELECLPELADKSKYKTIAMEYCQKKNWKIPFEICKERREWAELENVARFVGKVTFGTHTQFGQGSTKKNSLYDAYKKLIPMVIPKEEARNLILEKRRNYKKKTRKNIYKHPKSRLMEYAQYSNIAAPITTFHGTHNSLQNVTIWKATVIFCGNTVHATDVKKKAAESKCCSELLKIMRCFKK